MYLANSVIIYAQFINLRQQTMDYIEQTVKAFVQGEVQVKKLICDIINNKHLQFIYKKFSNIYWAASKQSMQFRITLGIERGLPC